MRNNILQLFEIHFFCSIALNIHSATYFRRHASNMISLRIHQPKFLPFCRLETDVYAAESSPCMPLLPTVPLSRRIAPRFLGSVFISADVICANMVWQKSSSVLKEQSAKQITKYVISLSESI